jgi:hypothetical protein
MRYLILLCILLVGCGAPREPGRVISKEYIPAHSDIQVMPTISFDGTIGPPSIESVDVPDQYILHTETGDVSVDQHTYEHADIGQRF